MPFTLTLTDEQCDEIATLGIGASLPLEDEEGWSVVDHVDERVLFKNRFGETLTIDTHDGTAFVSTAY